MFVDLDAFVEVKIHVLVLLEALLGADCFVDESTYLVLWEV